MWKYKQDLNNKEPKYKQIINAIVNDIEKGVLKKDDQLPSINELSFEFDIARDTVEKAYNELKSQSVITSVRGKGYFVQGLKNSQLRILLVLNKLSSYKKIIYYSLLKTLGTAATIDLQLHHYNAVLLNKIIEDNLGKYHYYVIMPHLYENIDEVDIFKTLNRIPKDELVILDKKCPEIEGEYLSVYQDFENDIYNTLVEANDAIEKYEELVLVFPETENYPLEIVKGFRSYCNNYKRKFSVVQEVNIIGIKNKTLFIVIEDNDLVLLVKKASDNNLVLGKNLGIISFNDTPLKEILAGGITTVTTHFEAMGITTGSLILEKQKIQIKNPFSIIRRNSL